MTQNGIDRQPITSKRPKLHRAARGVTGSHTNLSTVLSSPPWGALHTIHANRARKCAQDASRLSIDRLDASRLSIDRLDASRLSIDRLDASRLSIDRSDVTVG
jgi:hypothetical protein